MSARDRAYWRRVYLAALPEMIRVTFAPGISKEGALIAFEMLPGALGNFADMVLEIDRKRWEKDGDETRRKEWRS